MAKIGQWKKVCNVQKHLYNDDDDVITKRQNVSYNSICSSHIASQKEILAETSHMDVSCFAKTKNANRK